MQPHEAQYRRAVGPKTRHRAITQFCLSSKPRTTRRAFSSHNIDIVLISNKELYSRSMSLDLMAERSASLFSKCFGHAPRWLVAAPGRVNLIGEHTDYNDGYVLPMAIERYMVMAADRNHDREVTLHSATMPGSADVAFDLPVQRSQPEWANYSRGVIAGFQRL